MTHNTAHALAPGSDEDEDMMKKMMGFTGFDSTKVGNSKMSSQLKVTAQIFRNFTIFCSQ